MGKGNIQQFQDDATAHNEAQLSKAIDSVANAENNVADNEAKAAKRKMRDWKY